MAYDPNRDTCADCLYFQINPDDPANEEYGQVGQCKRRAPTYVNITESWEFAALTADNSCGEFESTISGPHAKCH